jgi:hypothetical protein
LLVIPVTYSLFITLVLACLTILLINLLSFTSKDHSNLSTLSFNLASITISLFRLVGYNTTILDSYSFVLGNCSVNLDLSIFAAITIEKD